MIHVAIDTSIFRTDPKRGRSAFKTLSKLCKNKAVQVHIPLIVMREFSTQQEDLLGEAFRQTKRSVRDLIKIAPSSAYESLIEIEKFLDGLQEGAIKEKHDELKAWAIENNAIVHEIDAAHGGMVFDSYFSGKKPFSKKKERLDIPDAFIYQTLLTIVNKTKEINFVVKDGAFADSCNGEAGITSYKSLEEFLDSKACKNAIKEVNNSEYSDSLLKSLAEHEGFIQEKISEILWNKLPSINFRDEGVPNETNSARIDDFYDASHFDSEVAPPYSVGGNAIYLPFRCIASCGIVYSVLTDQFIENDDVFSGAVAGFDENSTDQHCNAYEDVNLEVEGTISITIDLNDEGQKGISQDLKKIILEADFELEELASVRIEA